MKTSTTDNKTDRPTTTGTALEEQMYLAKVVRSEDDEVIRRISSVAFDFSCCDELHGVKMYRTREVSWMRLPTSSSIA